MIGRKYVTENTLLTITEESLCVSVNCLGLSGIPLQNYSPCFVFVGRVRDWIAQYTSRRNKVIIRNEESSTKIQLSPFKKNEFSFSGISVAGESQLSPSLSSLGISPPRPGTSQFSPSQSSLGLSPARTPQHSKKEIICVTPKFCVCPICTLSSVKTELICSSDDCPHYLHYACYLKHLETKYSGKYVENSMNEALCYSCVEGKVAENVSNTPGSMLV